MKVGGRDTKVLFRRVHVQTFEGGGSSPPTPPDTPGHYDRSPLPGPSPPQRLGVTLRPDLPIQGHPSPTSFSGLPTPQGLDLVSFPEFRRTVQVEESWGPDPV